MSKLADLKKQLVKKVEHDDVQSKAAVPKKLALKKGVTVADVVEKMEVAASSVAVKKMGRPAKNGVAMTAAEKQKAYRARKKAGLV